VDLVCLLLGATTETVESPQWSRKVQAQSSKVLMSDAPSESEFLVILSQGKVFNSFPNYGTKMLALEVTSGLQRGKPSTHHFICHN
jgi:hypothetical protein